MRSSLTVNQAKPKTSSFPLIPDLNSKSCAGPLFLQSCTGSRLGTERGSVRAARCFCCPCSLLCPPVLTGNVVGTSLLLLLLLLALFCLQGKYLKFNFYSAPVPFMSGSPFRFLVQ